MTHAEEQLGMIAVNVAWMVATTAAVHFGLTSPKTKDRLMLTHTLWWYPFCFGLVAVGAAATYELRGDRLLANSPTSELFMRLYIAVQIVAVPIECAQAGAFSKANFPKTAMTLAHHLVSSAGYLSGLLDGRCHFYGCAAGLSEVSTIFLNGMILTRQDALAGWFERNAPWFMVLNGIGLWASFLVFRIVLFPTIAVAFVYDMRTTPDNQLGLAFYGYPAIFSFLFYLSWQWFKKIHRGFLKKVLGRDSTAPSSRSSSPTDDDGLQKKKAKTAKAQ